MELKRTRSDSTSSASSLSSTGSLDELFPKSRAGLSLKVQPSHPALDIDQLLHDAVLEQNSVTQTTDFEPTDFAVVKLPGCTDVEGPNRGLSALYISSDAALPDDPDDFEDLDPTPPCLDLPAAGPEPLPLPAVAAPITPGEPVKRTTRRNRKRAARRRAKKRERRLKEVQLNLLRKIKVIAGGFDCRDLPKSQSGYLGTADEAGSSSAGSHSSPSQGEIPPDAHPRLHELGRMGYRVVPADDNVDLFIDGASRVYGWNSRTFGLPEKWQDTYREVEQAFKTLAGVVRKGKAGTKNSGGVSRGDYPWSLYGFSYGGGETRPTNSRLSQRDRAAWGEFLQNPHVLKTLDALMASFEMWAPDVYATYSDAHKRIIAENALLDCLHSSDPTKIPFASIAANLGPQTVCYKHRDLKNKANGLCIIYVLGNFDYRRGGHVILHEAKLVVEMRPGDALFIPSAVISHETVPIFEGEERYSLVLYSAGGLFRWLDGGSRSKKDWRASDKASHDSHFSSEKTEERWTDGWKEYCTLGSLAERQSRLERELEEERLRKLSKASDPQHGAKRPRAAAPHS